MAKTRILLTALSTLSSNWQDGSIIDLGNGKAESTLHPQEPLLIKLSEENIKVTHCITLETNKVREDTIPENDPSGRTSAALFEERLDYWLGDGIKKIAVPVSDGEPKEAVAQTVKEIETIVRNANGKTELYIQTNGGFRDIGLILTSVVYALGSKRIEPHFYTVHYQEKRGNLLEDDSVRVLDLVSALNEFFDYGRVGKSLDKYMAQGQTDDLCEGMRRINDGIIWCDIATIEDGCALLRTYFEKEESERNAPADVLLQLFEKRIRTDLRPLLQENCPVIEYVRWCEKKGFYQQLLVFVESRMYRDYLKANVFTVDRSAIEQLYEKWEYSEEESGYTITNAWLKWRFKRRAEKFPYEEFGKDIYDYNKAKAAVCGKARGALTTGKEGTEQLYVENPQTSEKIYLDRYINFGLHQQDADLAALLFTHYVLKQIRNDAGHMLGKSKDPSVKENIVNFYIKLCDSVMNASGTK